LRLKQSLRPLQLYHFNHQTNLISTGKINVKSENMIGNITWKIDRAHKLFCNMR